MPESFLLNYLIKGIVIGLIFGVPAGAVGAMTVQRTMEYGPRTGILTGIGSSAADCLYAGVGAFGLTFVTDFLLNHQKAINFAGGGFLLLLGLRLLVLGVFLGTLCWWVILAALTEKLKGRFSKHILNHMNKVFGIILSLFGLVVLTA